MTTDLSNGVEIVRSLADCLEAIAHPKRLEIVQYCMQPRTFTEIVQNLRMNPASFKFHCRVLVECDLIRKVQRGLYETTELGKLLMEIVKQASLIASTAQSTVPNQSL